MHITVWLMATASQVPTHVRHGISHISFIRCNCVLETVLLQGMIDGCDSL